MLETLTLNITKTYLINIFTAVTFDFISKSSSDRFTVSTVCLVFIYILNYKVTNLCSQQSVACVAGAF